MLFGNSKDDVIELKMDSDTIHQVDRIKYLGVWLDPQLAFSLQVDYSVAKAKRASAKIFTLFDFREGIPVQLGIDLYKALVRPHLEYAVPVWAAAGVKDIEKVEQVQVQSLRRIIGAKAHSSSVATEVITATLPIRIRIRDLCCREYLRIIRKEEGHCLRKLLSTSSRNGLRFSPLNYLSVMSKQLCRSLDGCSLENEYSTSASAVMLRIPRLFQASVVSSGSFDFHNWSQLEQQKALEEVHSFIQCNNSKSVMVFTDGAVYKGPVGCGACAAVLIPLLGDEEQYTISKAVGKKVYSLTCELEGIILGLEISLDYFRRSNNRKPRETVYILCDCSSAIDIIVNRLDLTSRLDIFHRLSILEDALSALQIDTLLVWIPGHHQIEFNETADLLAKETAHDIYTGSLSAPSVVSYSDAVKISASIASKSWQTKWERDTSGFYTRHLIPEVGTKVTFPDKRDVGISYCRLLLHDTLLREDAFRTGTSDTPICECGLDMESAEHFLLHCTIHQEARNELQLSLQEITDSSACTSRLYLSESILLAPRWNNVTKNQDKHIKAALFPYISDSKVKL